MDKQSVTSDTADSQQQQSLRWFPFSFIFSQIVGVSIVVLMAVWFGHFRGGVAWTSDPKKEFNYHPILMTVGMIFLYANAIMAYRIFRYEQKKKIKLLHAFLHLMVFCFAVVALKAVFDSHNLVMPPNANLYTMHSWLGLTTVILFSLQFVMGFITFLFPGLKMHLRALILPVHVFFGIGIFLLAIATALTGIMEKAIFTIRETYESFPPEGIIINCLGILLVIFAFMVVYVVVNPNFTRKALPEEELPLVQQALN